MSRTIACAVAAAALLGGCESMGAGGGGGAMSASPAAPTTNASAYVALAGASDMFEIQSSQVALRKAQSADVRSFAQMMIDHHTQTTVTLLTATRDAGLSAPPNALPPAKAQMVATLEATPESGFDRVYLNQQRMAHEEALAIHQTYASRGDNATLRQVAATATPIVQQHLTRVRAMPR